MSDLARRRSCCDDSTAENKHSNGHLLSNLQSPLQEEMKKYQLENNRIVGRVPFIPFLDEGDATFTVINNLIEVSPTHAACKLKYRDYMRPFNRISFKKRPDLFMIEQQEVGDIPISQSLEFKQAMFDMLGAKGVNDLSLAIDREIENYLVYGNNICELILTEKGAARMAKIVSYDFGMFRYENTSNPEDLGKYGYLCEDFANVNFNTDVKFQRYAMFPMMQEWPDGTLRCLIHSYDPVAGRDWYGIPFSFASIYSQFLEFQAGKYTSVATDHKFLASMIIESEGAAQDIKTTNEQKAEAAERVRKFNEIYTMKGAGNALQSPVISLTRPPGSTPSTFKDIVSNFDAESHKLMYEVSEKQIIRSWGMHAALLEQGGSSLSGGNFFYEIALNFYYTSIQPAVDKCLRSIQLALETAQKWVGYDNPNDLAVTLPMPEFIQKIKREEAAQTAQRAQENQPTI